MHLSITLYEESSQEEEEEEVLLMYPPKDKPLFFKTNFSLQKEMLYKRGTTVVL
jgi:hypothetical protein